MTKNQLAENKTYQEMGHPRSFLYSQLKKGIGFGYGFGICLDDKEAKMTKGCFAWTGAGDTIFWCDPAENLFVVFMTQFIGNMKQKTGIDLRMELRKLVYSALVKSNVDNK